MSCWKETIDTRWPVPDRKVYAMHHTPVVSLLRRQVAMLQMPKIIQDATRLVHAQEEENKANKETKY